MNSAMMPQDGTYSRKEISAEEFKRLFLMAEEIVSTIAYPETQEVVGKALGIYLPIDRKKSLTRLEENTAIILVVKLRYRIPSERKGIRLGAQMEDYEFCLVNYKKNNK